jgi:hypothetical protein
MLIKNFLFGLNLVLNCDNFQKAYHHFIDYVLIEFK